MMRPCSNPIQCMLMLRDKKNKETLPEQNRWVQIRDVHLVVSESLLVRTYESQVCFPTDLPTYRPRPSSVVLLAVAKRTSLPRWKTRCYHWLLLMVVREIRHFQIQYNTQLWKRWYSAPQCVIGLWDSTNSGWYRTMTIQDFYLHASIGRWEALQL